MLDWDTGSFRSFLLSFLNPVLRSLSHSRSFLVLVPVLVVITISNFAPGLVLVLVLHSVVSDVNLIPYFAIEDTSEKLRFLVRRRHRASTILFLHPHQSSLVALVCASPHLRFLFLMPSLIVIPLPFLMLLYLLIGTCLGNPFRQLSNG